MKINSVKLYNPKFGIKMTQSVKRGFDNLQYKIREEYGYNSNYDIIQDYLTDYINKHCQNLTLDYSFDTLSRKNLCDEISQKPYTLILKNMQNHVVKAPIDFDRASLEQDLYTPSNLVILMQNAEALSKKGK